MLDASDIARSRPEERFALHYRPEIDGLRSVAILPILLLHCGISVLKGGFIGVDVFFVISGFLITSIITREIETGRFTLQEFYRRRIVRILPALAVMVAATLLLGSYRLLPVPLSDLGSSAATTSLFGSNFYFYLTSGYFAQNAELQPLIHTWSLAVEEQFYLFYPLLLLALRRAGRKALIGVLVAIGITSFAIGGWLAIKDPSAGYFLLPSRAWELVAGGLVALGVYPPIAPGRWRSGLCVLALAGIVICALGTGPTWPFPVPFAVPPVAGAAFLLAYLPGTAAARLLETAPLRAIGRMSYSLYLWHRPIVAFYLIDRSAEMTWKDSVILLCTSFAAAALSYHFIERPALRRWRSSDVIPRIGASLPSAVILVTAAGSLAFVGVGLLVSREAWHIRSLPAAVVRVASFQGSDSTPAGKAQFSTGRCFEIPTSHAYDPACLVPDPDRPNVLLMGDSHAAQLSQALRNAMPRAHLIQSTAAGCRPLLHGTGLRRCRMIAENAFHRLDFAHVHTVVLAGRWYAEDMQPLVETIHFLQGKGARVIVVGPVVEYDADIPDALARAMLAGDPSRVARLRIQDRAPLDRRMGPIMTAAGASYVSWFALECPQGHCRLFSANGDPLHMDRTHVTPVWAAQMAGRIADKADLH